MIQSSGSLFLLRGIKRFSIDIAANCDRSVANAVKLPPAKKAYANMNSNTIPEIIILINAANPDPQ